MQNWTLALIALAGSLLFRCSLSPEVLGGAPMPGDPADPAPRGTDSLQGEWVCIYWNYEGLATGINFDARVADPWKHPIVSGEAWSWRPDPKAAPEPYARISTDGVAGLTIEIATVDRKENLQGIYDIRGDILRLCFSTDKPGAGRPNDFTIQPFEREVALTYRRVGVEDVEVRQAEIACTSEAIVADSSASQAFARLSLDAQAGRIAVPGFDLGAPHFDSALLKRLRRSIGVAQVKVVASQTALIAQSLLYIGRAQQRQARFDRLVMESRAEVRAKMLNRKWLQAIRGKTGNAEGLSDT